MFKFPIGDWNVSQAIVAYGIPDNLKAAVMKSDRNEPVINEEVAPFAEHY